MSARSQRTCLTATRRLTCDGKMCVALWPLLQQEAESNLSHLGEWKAEYIEEIRVEQLVPMRTFSGDFLWLVPCTSFLLQPHRRVVFCLVARTIVTKA